MATATALQRCGERLDRLSRSTLDSASLRLEAVGELGRVIGFDRFCWPIADPQTLLPLDAVAAHDYGPGVPRALVLEYSGGDFATKHDVACAPAAATSLSAATRGDLASSPRWDEVMRPVGIGDVAVVACRDGLGTWGWLEAYRDRDEGSFAEPDVDLLGRVGRAFGSALRRRVMDGRAGDPAAGAPPPGILVLDEGLRVASSTAGARVWLDTMPGADMYAALGILPAVFYPAAVRALAQPGGPAAGAMTRTVAGAWMKIDVAPLDGQHNGWVAVTLREATAPEIFGLLCRAYGLSRREREIVALLIAGLDTRAISRRMSISTWTVQDHLKSVFDKVGIHSRRELLASLSSTRDGEVAGGLDWATA